MKDLRDEHDAQKIYWPDLVYYFIIFDIRKAFLVAVYQTKTNLIKSLKEILRLCCNCDTRINFIHLKTLN